MTSVEGWLSILSCRRKTDIAISVGAGRCALRNNYLKTAQPTRAYPGPQLSARRSSVQCYGEPPGSSNYHFSFALSHLEIWSKSTKTPQNAAKPGTPRRGASQIPKRCNSKLLSFFRGIYSKGLCRSPVEPFVVVYSGGLLPTLHSCLFLLFGRLQAGLEVIWFWIHACPRHWALNDPRKPQRGSIAGASQLRCLPTHTNGLMARCHLFMS